MKNIYAITASILLAACCLLSVKQASAQNMIWNGSFEIVNSTNYPPGSPPPNCDASNNNTQLNDQLCHMNSWGQTGVGVGPNIDHYSCGCVGNPCTDGNRYIGFYPPDRLNLRISDPIQAGCTYTLRIDHARGGSFTAGLSATPNSCGTTLSTFNGPGGSTYITHTYTFTATAAMAGSIYLSLCNAASWNAIDNIRLTSTCHTNPTPVPATCGGCTPPPQPNGPGSLNVCEGTVVTLNVTGAPGNTYRWYTAPTGGTPVFTGNPYVFTATTTQTLYVSADAAGCESSREPIDINVTPAPTTPNISAGPNPGCVGQNISLSSNSPVNGTGRWECQSCPGPIPQLPSNSDNVVVTPTFAGVYTFRRVHSNPPCPDRVQTVTVSVNSNAPAPVIAVTPGTVCSGDVVALTSNSPAPGTGEWRCVTCPGALGNLPSTAQNVNVTPTVVGTYIVERVHRNAPCADQTEQTSFVVVEPAPAPVASALPLNLCEGQSTRLESNDPAPGTGEWICLNCPGTPANSIISTDLITNKTLFASGEYTFRRQHRSPAPCPDPAPVDILVTVEYEALPPVISASSTLACTNETITLTSNSGSKPGAYTNAITSWSCTGGNCGNVTFTDATADITDVVFSAPGVYTIRREHTSPIPCTFSAFEELTIEINDPATAPTPAASASPICLRDGVDLTSNDPTPAANTTPDAGMWTCVGGNCGNAVINDMNAANTRVDFAAPGTYTFQRTHTSGTPTCADPAPATVTVEVNQAPPFPAISADMLNLCAGGTARATSSSPMVMGNPQPNSGQWTCVGGNCGDANIASPNADATDITFAAGGTYTIVREHVSAAPCASPLTDELVFEVDETTVGGTLNSSATVCINDDSGLLELTGYTGDIVQWEYTTDCATFTNNITVVNSTSPVYQSPPLNATTCFRVMVQSGSCPPAYSSVAQITMQPGSQQPTLVNATTPVCPGTNATTYEIMNNPLVDEYVWTLPSEARLVSGQTTNQIEIDWVTLTPPGVYIITVRPYTNGCEGAVLSIPVTISPPAPTQPVSITGGPTQMCRGVNPTYIVENLDGNQITWSISPAGPQLAPNGDTVSVIFNAAPVGSYTLTAQASNACGVSPVQTLPLTLDEAPAAPGGIQVPALHCQGELATYAVTPVANVDRYVWSNSCGWSGSSNGPEINLVATNAGPCDISVYAENQCGATAVSTATVTTSNPPAATGPISGPTQLCPGGTGTYSVPSITGITKYIWGGLPPEARVTSGQRTNQINIDWGATPVGFYNIGVVVENECGISAPLELLVQITDPPAAAGPIVGEREVCIEQSEIYTTSLLPGVLYDWRLQPNTANVTTAGNSATIDFTTAGVYTLEVTPRNACGSGQSSFISIIVKDRELADAGTDRIICGPNTVVAGMPAGGTWSCANCPFPSTVTSAGVFGIFSGLPAGEIAVLNYTVTDDECGAHTSSITVTNDLPEPGLVTGGATLCAGDNATLRLSGYTQNATIVRWERSTDNFQSDVDIPNTGATLNVANLTENTQYRAVVRLGGNCPDQHSRHATVEVLPSVIASATPALQSTCSETAKVTGNMPLAGGNGTWRFVAGPTNAQIATTGVEGQISGMNTAGDYTFRWTVTNPAPCGPSSIDVVVRKLEDMPRIDAGPNIEVCESTANLNTPITPQGMDSRWIFVTGPNAAYISQNGEISNMRQPGKYVFKWRVTNPQCGTQVEDEVVVERKAPVTPAFAGSNRDACNESITLMGNMPEAGEEGEWSFVSGPVTPQVATDGNIGSVYGLTEPGEYVFRWTISNGVCPDSFSDVKITKGDFSRVPAVSPAYMEICDEEQIELMGDGEGQWSFVQGPSAATVSTVGSTGFVSNMTEPGVYKFRWSLFSDCDTTFVDVEIRKRAGVSAPVFAGGNQVLCGGTSALLVGSQPPEGATAFWRFVSGPVPAQVGTFGRFGTVGDLSVSGDYVFEWVVDAGPCGTQSDLVTISRAERPTVASAGPDQQLCGTTTTLVGNTPQIGAGQWEFVGGPMNANVTQNGSAGAVSGMNMPGAYTFRYTISNPPCPSSSSTVTVDVSPGTVPGSLGGGGTTVCSGANSGSLTLQGFEGDIVRWESSTDGFASINVSGTTGPVLNYSDLTETTEFRVVVKQGSCQEEVSNVAKVTVLPASTVANAGSDQTLCATSALLSGNAPAIGSGTWSFVSGPIAPSVTPAGNDLLVSDMNESGTYVFEYEINSGQCGTTTDEVIVEISAGSDAGALTGAAAHCGSQNTGTLALSGYNGSVVRWEMSTDNWVSFQAIANTSDQYSYTNLAQTTQFRAIVKDGICPEAYSNSVTVEIAPAIGTVDAGPDAQVCGSTRNVTGSPAGGSWTMVSGPTNVIISPGQNGSASISGLNPGQYVFRYEVSSAACGTSFDDVVLDVSNGSVAGGVVGSSTVCANGNSGTISLTGYAGVITKWEYSTDNWQTVNVLNNVTELQDYQNLQQTTQYRAVVKTGNCPEARSTDATIIVRQPVAAADAGPDITTCQSQITLQGSVAPGANISWTLLATTGNTPGLQVSGNTAVVSNLQPGNQYVFRYEVDNSPCAVTTDEMMVDVTGSLNAGTVGGAATVCQGASGTLSLQGFNGNIVRWESSTDNFLNASSINNTTATQVYTNIQQTTSYRAVVELPGCGQQFSLAATVTVLPKLQLNVDARMTCSGGMIEANAPNANGLVTYRIRPTIRPANNTGVFANLSPGTYAVEAQEPGGCTVSQTVVIGNAPDPVAITSVTLNGPNMAMVNWSSAGQGSTYELRYRVAGGNWMTVSGLSGTSFAIAGLTNGTNYEVQVRYRCLGGLQSNFSASEFFTTPSVRSFATKGDFENAMVYPNPSHGDFTVSFSAAQSGEAKLRMIDMKGAEVWTDTRVIHSGKNNLKVQVDLAPGVYVLDWTQGKARQRVKVILE